MNERPNPQRKLPGGEETLLEGLLERIVFASEEDSWSVLKLAVPGRRGEVTAVGNVFGVKPGETLRLGGRWVQDKKWGEQFQASSFRVIRPSTVEGIVRYLGSGLISGIGKAMAKRLVEKFGAATLEIIEHHPERLRQVPGIGPKRCRQIAEAWEQQRHVQRVMVFLQSHGVSTAFAIRIYKTYGADAEELVTENPYRLASDVFGIGFKSADRIAEHLGIPPDSPRRAEAGLLHLLGVGAERGHVFLPRSQLVREASDLLDQPEPILQRALDRLAKEGKAVVEPLPPPDSPISSESSSRDEAVYSPLLFEAETELADRLRSLQTATANLPEVSLERAIDWFEERESVTLADQQRAAVAAALTNRVLVITGGPGTGKTTLLRCIVDVLGAKDARLLLAAPTGRAARRLAEATGREARTVHRLLEYDPVQRVFTRGADYPLEADLVIVDEASMLDVSLARHVAAAVPPEGHLLLVGDVDQLPSVGPGRVLADLIRSGAVPVIRLTEIFRQAAKSQIVLNAHRINQGEMPLLEDISREDPRAIDFFFLERSDPERLVDTLQHLVVERIPRGFGFDAVGEIQILTPMNRGQLGVHNLNAVLQQRLNPSGKEIQRAGRRLRVHDKVMQLRNNYDLDVFNGDLGRVESLDEDEEELVVSFDGRRVRYSFGELDELTPAYACTIHKSQGSEYPCVVVPVHTQHYRMLQRNLLYTALTRAKKLAILVGQKRALSIAVSNQDTRRRFTRLAERLAKSG